MSVVIDVIDVIMDRLVYAMLILCYICDTNVVINVHNPSTALEMVFSGENLTFYDALYVTAKITKAILYIADQVLADTARRYIAVEVLRII